MSWWVWPKVGGIRVVGGGEYCRVKGMTRCVAKSGCGRGGEKGGHGMAGCVAKMGQKGNLKVREEGVAKKWPYSVNLQCR